MQVAGHWKRFTLSLVENNVNTMPASGRMDPEKKAILTTRLLLGWPMSSLMTWHPNISSRPNRRHRAHKGTCIETAKVMMAAGTNANATVVINRGFGESAN